MLKASNPIYEVQHITVPFGVWYKWGKHKGLDLRTKCDEYPQGIGTPYHAIADGEWLEVGKSKALGVYVRLKHRYAGREYISVYGHCEASTYKKGWREVRRGDVIGYSGRTGIMTAPHLHLELYENGKLIDPMKAIKAYQDFIERVEDCRFIDVDNNGEFWLIDGGKRYHAKDGDDCLRLMRQLSQGINSEDLSIIPIGEL